MKLSHIVHIEVKLHLALYLQEGQQSEELHDQGLERKNLSSLLFGGKRESFKFIKECLVDIPLKI